MLRRLKFSGLGMLKSRGKGAGNCRLPPKGYRNKAEGGEETMVFSSVSPVEVLEKKDRTGRGKQGRVSRNSEAVFF